MRKILIVGSFFFATACTQHNVAPQSGSSQERPRPAVFSQSPLSTTKGEKADYRIEGNVVHVNNHICAMSGSALREDQLDQFLSRVVYDGPDPKFQGKTLVFNQCCPMCVQTFPEKWTKERDSIMRFHGLTGS